jgi:hypothetical protein
MLVQDQFSGRLHQVPDQLMGYGLGEVVYDGLGNPVGWNPLETISNVVSGLLPGPIRNVVSGLLPGIPSSAPQPAMGLPLPVPGASPFPIPGALPFPFPGGGPQFPSPPRPWPLGWIRPSLPYTGLGPDRLYLRCAVWPGPKGLVPGNAANLPPGAQPWMPGMPGFPALPGPFRGRRRRHHRR